MTSRASLHNSRCTLDVVKSKFRQLDISGTGTIKANILIDVLAELGLPAAQTDTVVQKICPDAASLIEYNQFLEQIFLPGNSEPSPGGGDAHTTFDNTTPRRRLDRPRTNRLLRSSTLSQFASGSGLGSIHRALRTLCKGCLRNAADPLRALAEFCQEMGVSQESSAKMHDSLRIVVEADSALDADVEEPGPEEVIRWEQFARWCVEQLLLEVFEVADLSGSGTLSMEDLMVLLMLIAVQREEGDGISPQDAEHIVREFDRNLDGSLCKGEFLGMVHELEREADLWTDTAHMNCPMQLSSGLGKLPHLVLNFDVNNTVLIKDSVTSSDAHKLIATTLAGSCWGIMHRRRTSNVCPWVLIDHQPRAHPPWEGLTSYAQYVEAAFPFPKDGVFEDIQKVKRQQRQALQSFCEPGEPGEAMRPHLDKVLDVHQQSKTRLLPSFYQLLYDLKRAGRSFSIVFRTFGIDINEAFQTEFNAFCEGRCPYCPAGGPKLDGSDGGPDYRIDLDDPYSIGSFYRKNDVISIVWGTHKQPPETPEGQALGFDFYNDMLGIDARIGVEATVASLRDRTVSRCGTVAIRDFYPGWAQHQFHSSGGKPLFVNIEDDEAFQLIFDDHAQPEGPSIVDVIDVREYPTRVPMPQVYDIHMVKAMPLRSISDMAYFTDEVHRCEIAKTAQLMRRRKVARMLHDIESLRGSIVLLGGDHSSSHVRSSVDEGRNCVNERRNCVHDTLHEVSNCLHYTTWHELDTVRHAAPLPPDATYQPEDLVRERSKES